MGENYTAVSISNLRLTTQALLSHVDGQNSDLEQQIREMNEKLEFLLDLHTLRDSEDILLFDSEGNRLIPECNC